MQNLEAELEKARKHLIQTDPVLGKVIETYGPLVRLSPGDEDPFLSLCRKIVSQQISVKAAATVFRRLTELVDGDFRPEIMLSFSTEDLRGVGISRQKSSYLHSLSQHFVEEPEKFLNLHGLSNDEVIAALTSVKGIGKWSAEMFLMFNLHRLDVFSPDDVGLKNAMVNLYGLESPKRKELDAFAERWVPYRTVACWYLWHSLHNTPE